MERFSAKTVCILGRQPALGLAELERLYGAEHVRPAGDHALLDLPAEDIDFERLGGTLKVARVLSERPTVKWPELSKYLISEVPKHFESVPPGKFTLGLSAYGFKTDAREVGRAALSIKKATRQSGRPIRVVPNQTPMLNSAQVLHNKLTHKGAWELIYLKDGQKTWLAQTLFVQDIEAYGARDQARPARDARVGMLPPKLAQIMVNLAAGRPETRMGKHWDNGDGLGRFLVLDPFCGTGVILQEALLMGYSVYGTDIEPRMVDYSRQNLQWLVGKYPKIEGKVTVEAADATSYCWPGFSTIASEVYLGRPLTSLPPVDRLQPIITATNQIIKKFLENLSPQLRKDQAICLAVPAWRRPNGSFIQLPALAKLTEMGYTRLSFKYVNDSELVYFRESQIVARELLVLKRT